MGDINIKQLESLRWRMRVIETLTVIGTAWIALAVYQKKEELVYYLVAVSYTHLTLPTILLV